MHLYIFLIQYYRENNIKYNIEHTLYKCLLEGEDYKVCQQICNAYMYYKTKQYEKAEQEVVVLYSTRVEFRFEIHYLQALIATNKYYTSYKFQEQIDILQQYTTIEFKENHPEMYIRNYMLLIEFYAELGLNVKNSMSCHRFTLTLCHNLIHFLVTDSGAIAPDF